MRRSDFTITPFLQRSNARALWQILSTLLPIASLWYLLARINETSLTVFQKSFLSLPSICLLALFSSRAFSLMHDCGHNSLFRWRWLNRSMGFFLGVLNAIPQYPWSLDHAFHHRHNGNWEIYRGPVDVLTLNSYQSLSERGKLFYEISRHWLMLFPGGFYYLIIKPRLALVKAFADFIFSVIAELIDKLHNKNFSTILTISSRFKLTDSGYGNSFWEIFDLILNNFLVITSWILMSKWLGLSFFLICYSIVMTVSAAIFICIFFIQHNFKGSYAHSSDDWDSFLGAINGSSNLDLPNWLNWFFADISFHSVHHLCDRIPNYNLRACHFQNQHLLRSSTILKMQDIPNCFRYILWDSKLLKLTTIKKAKLVESFES